jgi:hypothetical protein
LAVQKENESWKTFEVAEEKKYDEMEGGAFIIPLGELYTIKRNEQHKFRQYAMENLLKAGIRRYLLIHSDWGWSEVVLRFGSGLQQKNKWLGRDNKIPTDKTENQDLRLPAFTSWLLRHGV